ncbi:MAG: site-specific recombinase [Pseudomonadota bacterium]
MKRIEQALQRCLLPDVDPVAAMTDVVRAIRPAHAEDIERVEHRMADLCVLLEGNVPYRQGLRKVLMGVLEGGRQVSLYAEAGILPNSGFFSELFRRISHRVLPMVRDPAYLKGMIDIIFSRPDDFEWLGNISRETWERLHASLHLHHVEGHDALIHTRNEMLEALNALSYRIAAIGLDPELSRNEASLEKFESPFLSLNVEMQTFLTEYRNWLRDSDVPIYDEKQLLVLIGQCHDLTHRIQKTALQNGTSITLTFKIRRLTQNLDRMEKILALLVAWRSPEEEENLFLRAVELTCELVREENRKNNLYDHLRQNLDLLSVRVTENASQRGEHYITSTRSEYFDMLRSAMGGGLVIGFMALCKVFYAKLHLAPLNEAIVFSLNYSLGFMLIHILGFTVATKQPAMTAAAIAASIGEATGKTRDLESLITLIARTVRSQMVAILGNVGVVIPVSVLIGSAIHLATGQHFVTPEKAGALLESINPLGLTLFYAAIAGVCLFLSGLIAGYYDNLATYNQIPERLQQARWMKRLFGKRGAIRVAEYVRHNLGALAGNFYFGLLLGGMAAIGVLFGLPFDIRHITFSGAYLGFSVTALDFGVEWSLVLVSLLGVLLIGMVNLLVSFTLALTVALKARQVTFEQGRQLLSGLLRRFLRMPGEFLLPPKKSSEGESV